MTDMPATVYDPAAWRLWESKWSATRFPRPAPHRAYIEYGTEHEPGSSIWCSAFAEAMGGDFREGVSVLDYGCGAGRFFGFMAERLRDFTYVGLEKPGQPNGLGELSVRRARGDYGGDRRAAFGLIGDPLERKALGHAEVAVVMSVFTHLPPEKVGAILGKLLPVATRGTVVFSAFLGEGMSLLLQDEADPGFYGFATLERRQVENALAELGLVGREAGRIVTQRDPVVLEHVLLRTEARRRRQFI